MQAGEGEDLPPRGQRGPTAVLGAMLPTSKASTGLNQVVKVLYQLTAAGCGWKPRRVRQSSFDVFYTREYD